MKHKNSLVFLKGILCLSMMHPKDLFFLMTPGLFFLPNILFFPQDLGFELLNA